MNWCRIITVNQYQVLVRLQHTPGHERPFRYEYRVVGQLNTGPRSHCETRKGAETLPLLYPLMGPQVEHEAREVLGGFLDQFKQQPTPLTWCHIAAPIPGRPQALAMQVPGYNVYLDTQTGLGPFTKARISIASEYEVALHTIQTAVYERLYSELDLAQLKPWFKILTVSGTRLLAQKALFTHKTSMYVIIVSGMYETRSKLMPYIWPETHLHFDTEHARDAAFDALSESDAITLFLRVTNYAKQYTPIGHKAVLSEWVRALDEHTVLYKCNNGVRLADHNSSKVIPARDLKHQQYLFEQTNFQ